MDIRYCNTQQTQIISKINTVALYFPSQRVVFLLLASSVHSLPTQEINYSEPATSCYNALDEKKAKQRNTKQKQN